MKSLSELLDLLDQFSVLSETKGLCERIQSHPNLLHDYQTLTEHQKQIVRQTVLKRAPQLDLLQQQNAVLQDLSSHVMVSDYLDLLKECQELADAISEILSQELTNNQSILL